MIIFINTFFVENIFIYNLLFYIFSINILVFELIEKKYIITLLDPNSTLLSHRKGLSYQVQIFSELFFS